MVGNAIFVGIKFIANSYAIVCMVSFLQRPLHWMINLCMILIQTALYPQMKIAPFNVNATMLNKYFRVSLRTFKVYVTPFNLNSCAV